MARVAPEIVEKVDVDHLVEPLVKNAGAELATAYDCTVLRANLIGLAGEGLTAMTEDARIEDRHHFKALVPRISELGGTLPRPRSDFHDPVSPTASLPRTPPTSRPCSRWW